MAKITKITAREIIASSGWPTVEASVTLDNGVVGTASVAYGASAGTKEAHVLLDGDRDRYQGHGMLKAISNIETVIAPLLIGQVAEEQQRLDQLMIVADNTDNKSRLGGNAILAVSMAVARAASLANKQELYRYLGQSYHLGSWPSLPKPMMVMVEGGKHASDSTDLQEYLITIEDDKGAEENVRRGLTVYNEVGQLLRQAGYHAKIGNEGAFAPAGIKNNEEPLDFITKAIDQAGFLAGTEVALAIDAAASEFYQNSTYFLRTENQTLNADQLIEKYRQWQDKYPLRSIEDPLSEFDWANWPSALKKLSPARVVADDITVTNKQLLQRGIELGIANSIIIKLNQAGTVTETIETCRLAERSGWSIIPSHRGGGETKDTFMVDLAVAVGAEYIKVGPTQPERTIKYDRLIEIEKNYLQ